MKWAQRIVWEHVQACMMSQGFEVVLMLIRLCVCDSAWGGGQSGVGIENGKLEKLFHMSVISSL